MDYFYFLRALFIYVLRYHQITFLKLSQETKQLVVQTLRKVLRLHDDPPDGSRLHRPLGYLATFAEMPTCLPCATLKHPSRSWILSLSILP